MSKSKLRLPAWQLVAIFFVLFFSYSYVHQGWGWNQNSRLALLHAVFEQRTVIIDDYNYHTGDKAIFNDHYYSDKAPGTAVLSVPAFGLAFYVHKLLGVDVTVNPGWTSIAWAATAGSVGLVVALGGLAMFVVLARRIDPRLAMIVTFGIFLGSLPFPYATMLFSHGGTIGLLSCALWATLTSWSRKGRAKVWYSILGGACAGLAVAGEYPAAISAGVLFLLIAKSGWRAAVLFSLGALIPLLLVPLYSWLAFGSLLSIGYSHTQGFGGMQEGLFGVTYPKLLALRSLSVAQHRGLFFWSPILLLFFPGLYHLFRESRSLFFASLFVPIAYFAFASSYIYWDGGFAFGPRHLSASIPFFVLAVGYGVRMFPRTGVILTAYSIALTGFATLIDAQTPNVYLHPITEFYIPELLERYHLESNLGHLMGLPGLWSVFPLIIFITVVTILLLWRLGKVVRGDRLFPPIIPHMWNLLNLAKK